MTLFHEHYMPAYRLSKLSTGYDQRRGYIRHKRTRQGTSHLPMHPRGCMIMFGCYRHIFAPLSPCASREIKLLELSKSPGSGRMQFVNQYKTKSGTLKPQDAYGLPISWRNFTVGLESLHRFSHEIEGNTGAQPARLVCCLSQRVPPQTYK